MVAALEGKFSRGSQASSSDRKFGLVFAGVLTIITCLPLLRHEPPRWWALALALVLAAIAIVRPQILHWPNRLWLALGDLLHRIVSPIVMGAIFFCCVTPTAWIMRWRGKDLLSLKWDTRVESYWTERPPVTVDERSMKHQF